MAISARQFATPFAATASWLKTLAFYALELSVFLVFFALYFLLRGAAPTDVPQATGNALRIIQLERDLGVFREAAWQQAALGQQWLIDLANVVYMHLHLNLLLLAGFFIFRTDNRKYRVVRNALLLSAFIGVPFYHLIPVTPPRLMSQSGYDFGFVDTLADVRRPRPGPLANWYAAIPSSHFGWILLLTFAVFWTWTSRWLRTGMLGFLALMWWAIVVTANHYFFDMVLGAAIVSVTFVLALWFERWADAHPTAMRRCTFWVGPVRVPF